MRCLAIISAALVMMFVPSLTLADSVISQYQMVTGRNVYAPSVMQDGSVYKMWYGGWHVQGDFPNDDILYRESTNGIVWGSAQYIRDSATNKPIREALNLYHVNDPTVIKAWNAVLQQYTYWIYFSGINCNPVVCGGQNHKIWVGSGSDGKKFGAFRVIINDYLGQGVFSPSVVRINDDAGEFWLYYQVAGLADKLVLSKLIGGTTVTSTQIVTTNPGTLGGMHNPDISCKPDGTTYPCKPGGQWTLMYNRIDGPTNRFDIYKRTSTDGMTWSNDELILYSGCSPYCIAQTPNARWINISQYWLYYGLDESLTDWNGPDAEIHGWLMQD